jgi:hypothetical protein
VTATPSRTPTGTLVTGASGVVFSPTPGQDVNGGCNFTLTSSFTATCRVNNTDGPAVLTIPLQGGGQVQLTCAPSRGAITATCTGSFAGAPLIGGQATVTVNGVLVAGGTIVAGAVVFPTPIAGVPPLPPPFPAPLLPPLPPLPPPPPLLAPPPALVPPPLAAPEAPGVPVIPEAESLVLLAAGLGLLLVATWCRRRP